MDNLSINYEFNSIIQSLKNNIEYKYNIEYYRLYEFIKIDVNRLYVSDLSNDVLIQVLFALTTNTTITELQINKHKFDTRSITMLTSMLVKNTSLTLIQINDTYINKSNIESISTAILKNNSIKNLYFINCDLNMIEMDIILFLSQNKNIEVIHISNVYIEPIHNFHKCGITYSKENHYDETRHSLKIYGAYNDRLIKIINIMSIYNYTHLQIEKCEINKSAAIVLSNLIEKKLSIVNLEFWDILLNEETEKYISDALNKNSSIQELIFYHGATNNNKYNLLDVLYDHKSIKNINFDIDIRDNEKIMHIIEHNSNITSCTLYFKNSIGNDFNFVYFASVICNNVSLVSLSIYINYVIDVKNAEILSSALKNNHTLKELILGDIMINESGIILIIESLNVSVTSIIFTEYQNYSDDGLNSIINILQNNYSLSEIELGMNDITIDKKYFMMIESITTRNIENYKDRRFKTTKAIL